MKKLIIANWKMHYGPIQAGSWVRAFRRERLPKDVDIVVAVPFVSLAAVRSSLGRASIPALAAQDAAWASEGPFTGEISPDMLKELGVTYCIVGHSERRIHLGETDGMVAKKAAALQSAGITPVICVGETEAQRKKNESLKVVRAQVQSAISELSLRGAHSSIVIAYEPVWAISTAGTARACPPQIAKEMHQAIRAVVAKKSANPEAVRVIYGGSVDQRSVSEYMTTTGIDGVLAGGASLDPRNFALLCRAAIPA